MYLLERHDVRRALVILAAVAVLVQTGCTTSPRSGAASSASAGAVAPAEGECPREVPESAPDPTYLSIGFLQALMGPCYYAAEAGDDGALYHSVHVDPSLGYDQPDIRLEILSGTEGYERWESVKGIPDTPDPDYEHLDDKFFGGGVLLRWATGDYAGFNACVCNHETKTGAFLSVKLDGKSSGNDTPRGVKLTQDQVKFYKTATDTAESRLFQLLEKLIGPLRTLARQ